MKIFIKIISLLIVCVSCNHLMDIDSTDFYTEDTFWKTASHATEAVNGCYRALNNDDLYNTETPFMYEVMTANAYHKDNFHSARDFARGTQTATTLGMNWVTWRGCYRGIGRCNAVIEKVPLIDMEEDLKDRIVAEAKFLRALFYQKMNVVFNGVPLVLTTPNPDEHGDLPRSSYEDVKAQIIKDLDDAASILPVEYTSSEDGRATKGAALMLKAKVLLQDYEYTEVVSTLEQLFDLDRYSLFPDYNGIFRKANEGNSEIIFDVRYINPDLRNSFDLFHAQYNTQAPVQELVDVYQMIDGKSIDESPLYDEDNMYENRDPRFVQTILYLGAPWRSRVATEVDLHQTGYAFIKYTEYNATTVGTIAYSDVNYVLLRFADALLMYAEALNELEGPVEKVYQVINDIRGRISVEMPPLPAGLSKDGMREAIRLERRVELAGEGHYFYDIRRWKTIENEMNSSVTTHDRRVIATRSFNPARDYYWPIPYTQIDLNPNLVQNPNY